MGSPPATRSRSCVARWLENLVQSASENDNVGSGCGGDGIDLDQLRLGRRIFARSCLDWTQRRPHLAGALPAAVTSTFPDRGWLDRSSRRGLRVAADYDQQLDRWLGP